MEKGEGIVTAEEQREARIRRDGGGQGLAWVGAVVRTLQWHRQSWRRQQQHHPQTPEGGKKGDPKKHRSTCDSLEPASWLQSQRALGELSPGPSGARKGSQRTSCSHCPQSPLYKGTQPAWAPTAHPNTEGRDSQADSEGQDPGRGKWVREGWGCRLPGGDSCWSSWGRG